MIKKVTILLLLTFSVVCESQAACNWTDNIGTVATPYAPSDVLACVSDAASKTGDVTIYIPETPSADWTTEVTINMSSWTTPTKLTIAGGGPLSTIITTASENGYTEAFHFYGKDGIKLEIKDIGFVINSTSSAIRIQGDVGKTNPEVTGFRIHGCSFTALTVARLGMYIHAGNYGVIDNNTFSGVRVGYMGVASSNSLITEQDPVFSSAAELGSSKFVFIENNTIDGTSYFQNAIDANGAGKFVFRYNDVINTYVETHSGCQNGSRGVRAFEIYGNSITVNSSIPTSARAFTGDIRSGSGLIFSNSQSGLFNLNKFVIDNMSGCTNKYCGQDDYDNRIQRTTNGYNTDWSGNPAPSCTTYPCQDQIGRGQDTGWGTEQTLEGLYTWSNRYSGGYVTMAVNPASCEATSTFLQENRDFYNYTSSFDGTSGVGCGTLSNRPATCTTGVGYWATNQKCDDLTGMVGVNPVTPISGTLYICGETGWTDGSTYTPYTYPHPLRVQKFSGNVMIGGAGLYN